MVLNFSNFSILSQFFIVKFSDDQKKGLGGWAHSLQRAVLVIEPERRGRGREFDREVCPQGRDFDRAWRMSSPSSQSIFC